MQLHCFFDPINVFFHHASLRWQYSRICNKNKCPHVGTKGKCDHEEEKDKCIPYQLQRLFLQLQTTNEKSVETNDLTKSFGWGSEEGKKAKEIYVLTIVAKSDIYSYHCKFKNYACVFIANYFAAT